MPPEAFVSVLPHVGTCDAVCAIPACEQMPSLRREWFDIIVLGEESARPKPHPDPYQDALKAFGIQPDEAIICEDSPSGAVLKLQFR